MAQSLLNTAGHARASVIAPRFRGESISGRHHKLLLIVDDEPFLNRLLALADELSVDVRQEMASVDAILAYRLNWTPQAIVIDQLMPRSEYYAAIRALRSAFGVPVLAITAEFRSADQMPEPCVLLLGREAAIAEIRRITRCVDGDQAVMSIGALTLDQVHYDATLNGARLRLSPDEATTLALLMQHVGSVVHRRTLVSALGGQQRDLDPRIIDVHVVRLMVKLGSGSPVTIERSQDREGYMLNPVDAQLTMHASFT
jgi:two-component system response regulator BaeR